MKIYADTNFFTAFLSTSVNTNTALALLAAASNAAMVPLPVTRLLRMETINAFQRMVYDTRRGMEMFAMTLEGALIAEANFFDLIAEGTVCREQDTDAVMLESIFQNLAHRHTARHGFRTYDIVHVATALLLGCETFWSFDAKAKKLAKLEGLATS